MLLSLRRQIIGGSVVVSTCLITFRVLVSSRNGGVLTGVFQERGSVDRTDLVWFRLCTSCRRALHKQNVSGSLLSSLVDRASL